MGRGRRRQGGDGGEHRERMRDELRGARFRGDGLGHGRGDGEALCDGREVDRRDGVVLGEVEVGVARPRGAQEEGVVVVCRLGELEVEDGRRWAMDV